MNGLAATLALVAAICFALAATLWQRAALNMSGISFRRPKSLLLLLTSWVWLLGLAAQVVGVALQAAALDRGRVSIIQPLLVTTVIWALPLGYFLTRQTIGAREVIGAAIIVVGLALFALFGHPAAGVDNAPGSDWVASILVICAACVALLVFANSGSLSMKAALLGTVAGLLYGLSATLIKPVVESLSVANPVVSVMLGALVLQERLEKNPPWHAVVAVGALGLALVGSVVISSARANEEESDEQRPAAPASAAAQPAD